MTVTKKQKHNGAGNGAEHDLAAKTLTGDLRDALLVIAKELPDVWPKLRQHQQESAIWKIQRASERLVERAVALIRADEHPFLLCRVEKVVIDDKGAKLQLAASTVAGEQLDATRLQGKRIVLIEASPAPFLGERAPAKVEADQPQLGIDAAQAV